MKKTRWRWLSQGEQKCAASTFSFAPIGNQQAKRKARKSRHFLHRPLSHEFSRVALDDRFRALGEAGEPIALCRIVRRLSQQLEQSLFPREQRTRLVSGTVRFESFAAGINVVVGGLMDVSRTRQAHSRSRMTTSGSRRKPTWPRRLPARARARRSGAACFGEVQTRE